MLIATCYTRINGKMYMRGDEIPDNITEEKKNWLMEAGAIKEVAPAGQPQRAAEPTEESLSEEAEDETQEAETESAQEEADEEAEAPEIDVMAGIVPGDGQEAEKPARKTVKKQTGRRKSG